MVVKAVLTLVSAAVAGVVAVAQWRRRATTGTAPLALVMAAAAFWAVAEVAAANAPWPLARDLASPALLPAGSLVSAGALWYALHLSGRESFLTRRTALVLAAEPVLVVVASATNGFHQLVVVDGPSGQRPAVLFWVHTAWCYGLIVAAIVLLARTAARSVPGHRRVLVLVLASLAPPLLGNVASLVFEAQDLDLTGGLFLVTASLWLWVERSRHRLRRTPISTQQVLRTLPDAVVVIDDDGVVVSVNEAALALLERTPSDVVGAPWARIARDVLPSEVASTTRTVTMLDDGRHLDVRITPMYAPNGSVAGSVVVARDVTELERMRAELADQVLRDPLTGLHNRRHLDAVLARIDAGGASERSVVAAVVDLDHFKRVNDRYGHEVGDQVLVAFADQLRRLFRSDDVVARLGGEEFAILLPDAPLDDVVRRLDDLRERCAAMTFPSAPGLQITLSAGVASLDPAHPDPVPLLVRADREMYRSKAAGRDRVTAAGSR